MNRVIRTKSKAKGTSGLADLLRTLLANGFHLDSAKRVTSSACILHIHNFDIFETRANYSLLYAPRVLPESIIQGFLSEAKRSRTQPIGLGLITSTVFTCFEEQTFFKKLGGAVNSSLILNPKLEDILHSLGHNKVPNGISGDADDLLEEYSAECLRFILNHSARRYGIERRFESVPDGVALGSNGLVFYFDSKAYRKGYEISADDIRRFADYSADYNRKYEALLGRLHVFMVITGTFKQTRPILAQKSEELYSKCQTPLCCMTARELGLITILLQGNNRFRTALNWKKLLASPIVTFAAVSEQLRTLRKDQLT